MYWDKPDDLLPNVSVFVHHILGRASEFSLLQDSCFRYIKFHLIFNVSLSSITFYLFNAITQQQLWKGS